MKTNFVLFLIISPLVLGYIPVYAQISSITVSTDKTSYLYGDTVFISGTVGKFIPSSSVSIKVLDSSNKLVQVIQADVNPDKSYSATMRITGNLWESSGAYQIKVKYGNVQDSSLTKFNLTLNRPPSAQKTFQVEGSYKTGSYSITGGSIGSIRGDPQTHSLIVSINSTSKGLLTLTMPRDIIDSTTTSGYDVPFSVFIDEVQIKPLDTGEDKNYRTLTMMFSQGDKEIKIVGTSVVPEFGPIAAIIVTIAMTSSLVISRRFHTF